MNAEDVRDQSADAEDIGAPEATSSNDEATADAEATSNADPVDAAEGTNFADLLTDLGKAAQDTASSLSDTVGDGEAAVRAGLEEAEGTIRQHPLLAVGIAAGVGFVLGLLLRGSGQSDDG